MTTSPDYAPQTATHIPTAASLTGPRGVVEKRSKETIVDQTMTASEEQTRTATLLSKAKAHLYPNYAQPSLVMDRGKGAMLWDSSGKRYVDFFAGIAVGTLGHGNSELSAALKGQADKLIQLSNYFYTAPNIELAEKLCALAQMDRAFFCNSGTEANEAALKLCRRHFYDQGQTKREIVIAFDGSFHGRTLGSLTATGQEKYRNGFGPIAGAVHSPFGDLEAARALMNEKVAAVLVEPILGEGGVVPANDGFLKGLRDLCSASGALLIVDEIQTGVGRTGKFLACEHVGVKADVVTLAKGLGGGVPIGALLCKEEFANALPPGSHGTTFGGNPLASAAALCVLNVLERDKLIERTAALGKRLELALLELVSKHSCISAQRGQGLLQALVLTDPTQGSAIISALREAGLLISFTGGTALRLTPPLTINDDELKEGLQILDQVLGSFS